jgi:hypothetical protein
MNQNPQESQPCKRCKAPLLWARNVDTGKWVPLDAKQRLMFVVDAIGDCRAVKVYENHFITCEFADEFRKKKNDSRTTILGEGQ